MCKRYYPRAMDVKKMDKQELETRQNEEKAPETFRTLSEERQHGIYVRALRKELKKRWKNNKKKDCYF